MKIRLTLLMKAPKNLWISLKQKQKAYLSGFGNQMKVNPDKYHLLISSSCQSELKIGNVTITSSICEK